MKNLLVRGFCGSFALLALVLLSLGEARAWAEGLAGSYSMEMRLTPIAGYQVSGYETQNVLRVYAYLPPIVRWNGGGTGPLEYQPAYNQPWVDEFCENGDPDNQNDFPASPEDCTNIRENDPHYRPRFDLNRSNQFFYGHAMRVVDEARDHNPQVTVIFILTQGTDYGAPGDQWTWNPLNPANNVQGVDASSYRDLITNTDQNDPAQSYFYGYVDQMISTFSGYSNVYFEVMNEGTVGQVNTDPWQNQMVTYIQNHPNRGSIKVLKSAPETDAGGYDDDVLITSSADAISVSIPFIVENQQWSCADIENSPDQIPDASSFNVGHPGRPVFFDTDHNCPGDPYFSPAGIDMLYCKGYNILKLDVVSNNAAEQELAKIGSCANGSSYCDNLCSPRNN